ncbi:MAG: choloylglycine hydrolase [Acutalibacteraceae bacterium]|nr:choloylglycine hydrolase [Acutalibacteraceae bacterium]
MCTAITYNSGDFYFGRTLDYEHSFGEEIVITPRFFPFRFSQEHYAIIGMAHIEDGYPLYYDAANEKGLCMAGLNFVGNAHYGENKVDSNNIAHFELIPYILSMCATVNEAEEIIKNSNITAEPFNEYLPTAELHWLIADKNRAITVECVKEGVKIYENKVGVLTNNPPFDMQLTFLNNYMGLSAKEPQNLFSKTLDLKPYSRGMGAMGLPGDLSSSSRFVRAAFTKSNSVLCERENEAVAQFFHILGSVEQVEGCCMLGNNKYEKTIYTSCINANKGIYYYKPYENFRINAVNMRHVDLDGATLIKYPLNLSADIKNQN